MNQDPKITNWDGVKYKCWGCGKLHQPPSYFVYGTPEWCDECGGFVISPSGKMQVVVLEGNIDDHIIKLDE